METFLILHFMFLWAQNEFFFYAVAIPTSNTTNPLKIIAGDSLNITCDVVEDAATVTWFRNGRSVLLITNATSCKFLKINALETYNYSVTCDQQKRFSMAKYGVNSSDDNTTWSCEVFSLNYTNLGTSLGVTVYIYTLTTTDSIPTTTGTTTTTTITTTTTTGTSTSLNSTSMPSSTSNVSIDSTTTKPTTTGPGASTTNTSSMLISSTTVLPANVTSNTSTVPGSTSINPTTVLPTNVTNNTALSTTTSNTNRNGAESKVSDFDIKVIVPAVVVPCGLLIIGAIILLVVLCVRRRAGKNVPKSQDGIGIKYRDKNKDRWKPSTGHGKVTNNHGEYITPDGFIIYPGPAARSTTRSYKDNKSHGVTDQYGRPDSWTYNHQANYTPNTYTSAYTQKGKHRVSDQYSEPYRDVYGYQTAYLPSTHKSARTYEYMADNYDIEGHQQASHPIATSRLAYGQTAYYPQTGFYGQNSHDAYYRADGQYSYGQMSRSHRDYNRQKQQRNYYSQYEMTDYRHDKIGDMHTKQDTSFYY